MPDSRMELLVRYYRPGTGSAQFTYRLAAFRSTEFGKSVVAIRCISAHDDSRSFTSGLRTIDTVDTSEALFSALKTLNNHHLMLRPVPCAIEAPEASMAC